MKQFQTAISLAFFALRLNRTRGFITMGIIAIGISSLVGMQTSIDGLKWSLVSNLNSLGTNTFGINNQKAVIRRGGPGAKQENHPEIEYHEAWEFKKRLSGDNTVSLSTTAAAGLVVSYQSRHTEAEIMVTAADENHLELSQIPLMEGRNFSSLECSRGHRVAIIGSAFNALLFGNSSGLNREINLGNEKVRIIGIATSRGNAMGATLDKMVIIPIVTARKLFATSLINNYQIKVKSDDVFNLERSISESSGLMRMVRRLSPGEVNNFEIIKSDALQEMLDENLFYVRVAATFIGMITLAGAVVALMNIMLVSVSDRTREIGTRMAVGASSTSIKMQFLSEAVLISLLGGAVGIFLGIGIGNILMLALSMNLKIPFDWILIAVILCLVVGVVAGYAPAAKAASLDPIESLRHE